MNGHTTDARAFIGIVDNDPLVARALEAMFTDRPTPLKVLWNVRSAGEALTLCDDVMTRPDAVLTDLMMPLMDGRQLAERLRAQYPSLGIVGMSAFQMMHTVEELRSAGMSQVLRKEAPLEDYVHAIGMALGDRALIDWTERSLAFERMMLTDTEITVLREYLKGRTTPAVARLLHMSEGTVKTHMRNAYRKMGVHSRAEAIRICVREHLL